MTTLWALLWCGVIAGPLFSTVYLIEGYLRPGYNPLREPVSALSHGSRGWVQQANFFITGFLLTGFAVGVIALGPLGSIWAALLLVTHGASLLGAGACITDFGLRSGDSPASRSTSGILHDVFSTMVFVALSAACGIYSYLFFARGFSGWGLYSVVSGVLYALGFVVSAAAFNPASALAPVGGLIQRVTIITGALWVTLFSFYLLGK